MPGVSADGNSSVPFQSLGNFEGAILRMLIMLLALLVSGIPLALLSALPWSR